MLGLMQHHSLLISSLIEHAERHHPEGEVVSRRVEGDIHRYTWADVARRSRQLAHALDGENLAFSDRVATLAWNGYRHLELYYGVSGTGRVLHTLNPRLHPQQLAWIVNHAEDQILCFDMTFLPLVQAVHTKCPTVRKWVALCDADKLPADSGIPNLVSYEAWIAQHPTTYSWPEFDEARIRTTSAPATVSPCFSAAARLSAFSFSRRSRLASKTARLASLARRAFFCGSRKLRA